MAAPPRPVDRRDTPAGRSRGTAGISVLELVVVLALTLVGSAIGLSAFRDIAAERGGREAARQLMHDLQAIAYAARRSGTTHAARLTTASPPTLEVFVDGNGNGVRAVDIAGGIDRPTGPPRHAFTQAPALLAIVRDVPTTDHGGTLAAGSAPVRFGVTPFISFSAHRTGTSGSIYVAGPTGAQYAIRVLGTTGRLRLLCLETRAMVWEGC